MSALTTKRPPFSLARRRLAGPAPTRPVVAAAAAAAVPPPEQPPQIVAPVTTFEDAADWLAERAASLAERSGRRIVIGIVGPPGGGKSTLAACVRARADALLRRRPLRRQRESGAAAEEEGQPLAVVLPMDGFHYTRAQLDAFPDPAAAHARRGAPWTFDADAFVAAVGVAAAGRSAVAVPSFDHAIKDPVPSAIRIGPAAQVVLVEGNYLLLDEAPWRRLWAGGGGPGGSSGPPPPPLCDDTWFVDAPLEAAMAHVLARQTSEMGLSAEEARGRVEGNDAPNARAVLATRGRARVLVPGELPMRDC
jgi:pantothenate kinase